MFVTKGRYNRDLQSERDVQDVMRLHHLSEVRALQGQIDLLKEQITRLDKLVFPPQSPTPVTKEAYEIDNVISVSEKPSEMSEEERTKMLEGVRELDLIMSGNYDYDEVSE